MRQKNPNLAVIVAALVAFTILGGCWLHAGGSPSDLSGIGGAVASVTWLLISGRQPGDRGQP
ncbi:hypothetical protein AB0876_33490 [Mycobacterium sp. NPDC049093]